MLIWLGFIYDLLVVIVMATMEKLEKTMKAIQEVLEDPFVPVTQLASVTSLIKSLYPAYGDVVFLWSKSTQMIIAADDNWGRMVSLAQKSKTELKFWLTYIPDNNGMPIQTPVAPVIITFSDDSATGCASTLTPHPNQDKHRQFSEAEQLTSSTYRELLCVYHSLEQAKDILTDQSVRWFTDSANICSIVCKGSMVPDLLQLAILIFDLAKRYRIKLAMTWVSREENGEEDATCMSRIIDYDDWGVHHNWLRHILFIYLFIYCHLYSAFSIVQCPNALYRL